MLPLLLLPLVLLLVLPLMLPLMLLLLVLQASCGVVAADKDSPAVLSAKMQRLLKDLQQSERTFCWIADWC